VHMKRHWDSHFRSKCFQRVDDEVHRGGSNHVDGLAAQNVSLLAVAVLVCSSHVAVANCSDSRIALFHGKEPV
jgi:protein phosphatase 2C